MTVPDNTPLAPGTPFIKTWRVLNSGTCNWEPGTQLVLVSGNPMGGPAAVSVPAAAAGAQTDISVNLTAPTAPGTYRSNWRLQAPNGTRFGAMIWAQIVVPAPATEVPEPPTAEPTETPTATPTVRPAAADLFVSEYSWTPDMPSQGSPFHVRIGVYNQGNIASGAFQVQWWLSVHAPAPNCTWDVPSVAARGGRILECDYTPGGWADYPSRVVVDSGNTVAESDESNNTLERTISVRPPLQADLRVVGLDLSTWSARVGQPVVASITLRNAGGVAVPDFNVRLLQQTPGAACPAGPGLVLFDVPAALDVNESRAFSYPFTATAVGTYQLCVVLDHMNRVEESNEGNNAMRPDRNLVVIP